MEFEDFVYWLRVVSGWLCLLLAFFFMIKFGARGDLGFGLLSCVIFGGAGGFLLAKPLGMKAGNFVGECAYHPRTFLKNPGSKVAVALALESKKRYSEAEKAFLEIKKEGEWGRRIALAFANMELKWKGANGGAPDAIAALLEYLSGRKAPEAGDAEVVLMICDLYADCGSPEKASELLKAELSLADVCDADRKLLSARAKSMGNSSL